MQIAKIKFLNLFKNAKKSELKNLVLEKENLLYSTPFNIF